MLDRFGENLLVGPPEGATSTSPSNGALGTHSSTNDTAPASPSAFAGLQLAPNEGEAAIEQGRAFLASGELDQAVAELTRAIRLAPDAPEAYLLRGQAIEQQGEHDQALADYNSAIQIDIGQLLTFAQRLVALTTRRDFDSAVADADQSLRINQRLCRTCFLRGALHARRGDWARAAADYSQVIQLDPTNGVAFLRRGQVSASRGEWAKAVADYTEALRLDPRNAETVNSRGEALVRLGQSDAAVADFTEALRLDPHFTQARTNRAEAHLRRGEFDQAITDYNQAVHLAPGSARPYVGRGLARVETGDYERAIADLTRALALGAAPGSSSDSPNLVDRLKSAYDQMVAGLTQFKRLCRQAATECDLATPADGSLPTGAADGPPSATSRLPAPQRGELASAERLSASPLAREAVASSRQAPLARTAPAVARSGPELSSGTDLETASYSAGTRESESLHQEEPDRTARQQRRAARYCRQGQVAKQEGDHDRAVAAYTAAVAADPECAEAYLERGLLHRLARRYDEAVADFDAVIQIQPTGEAYFRRAVAFAEQSDFDRAFADFDEAIRREPDHAVAYLNRGLTAVAVGEFERAAEDADHALRIDPSLTRARFLRGLSLSKLGRYDQAAGDFDAVLAQDPDNARAHNQRGLAYAAEGNHDEAIAAFSEALRLAPDFDAPFFNRGIAYHNTGDHEQAIGEFTEFLHRRSQHAPAYYQRGLAYLAQKDFDLAINDFNRAVQLDPNLTQSYMSCLEATRAKYEAKSAPAEVAPPPKAAPRRALDARRDAPLLPLEPPSPPVPGPAARGPLPETKSEAVSPTAHNRPATEQTLAPIAPTQPDVPAGKLPITCPECETVGLLDLRNLGKKFRCPGCNIWWRTTAAGNLEETDEPDEPSAIAPVTKGPQPAKGKAPAKAAKPPANKPTRRKQESSIGHAGLWARTALRTKTARWMMVVGLLVFVALIPVLFPSLFPSELRSRGQQVAKAWLAKDTEQLKQFAEPSQAGSVPRWLELNPPPDLTGQPAVNVTVERNDGKTAEIMIQVKAKKSNGTLGYYTYRHRWVSKNGVWYMQPSLPPPGVATNQGGKGA